MKKTKLLTTSIVCALVGVGAISTLTGCGKKDEPIDSLPFAFSIALKSGRSELMQGATDQVVVYDNGGTSNRNFKFYSTNPARASIDENTGMVKVPDAAELGEVTFYVKEENVPNPSELTRSINIITKNVSDATGGFNYANAAGPEGIAKRTEILGKLEKYAMDSHLTGITLFDNGGYVRYADRVELGASEYITGYGYGLLTEGQLHGTLPGDEASTPENFPDYMHSSIAQDSLKINQYTATGSQVSDLASYITSSYWSTKLSNDKTKYEWYPSLATDQVYRPKVNGDGSISYDASKSDNLAPIPMEYDEGGSKTMFKKWRIYVKTDGDVNGSNMKFHQLHRNPDGNIVSGTFDNRPIGIEDYVFPYKLLLTGSNALIRGTEMANDTSYGIKGAARYYSNTQKMVDTNDILKQFDDDVTAGKLGINSGTDQNGAYLDLELINPIDSFTAMYTLSSSLVSPLPQSMFMNYTDKGGTYHGEAIRDNFYDAANNYGTFNGIDAHHVIMDYTVSCGPFTLVRWEKNQQIAFKRNDDWFEHSVQGRYKIPGVYFRICDTSQNTEKAWEYFVAGNLDSVGIPTSKVQEWKDRQDQGVRQTQGDSTFKLNVNSCTQAQWDAKFGPNGSVKPNQNWNVKQWMSNSNFLDGLFYSIDRRAFAEKRGVTPSINYFSDSYMSDPQHSVSYNSTPAHQAAVKGYAEDYGYNVDKAIACFRNAIYELAAQGRALGTKENPAIWDISIIWMYQSDLREYGDDIIAYFERAFNDEAVCGGKVKLVVSQSAVTQWEQVYNDHMMLGKFDLGFGAISGNSFNPLNFMEVLKSDNSSSFTLNWGADTSVVDPVHPIIYDDGNGAKAWSFDGLWEVADHGGILSKGSKVNTVDKCKFTTDSFKRGGQPMYAGDLYNGAFDLQIPIDFVNLAGSSSQVTFDISHVDCFVYGKPNVVLAEKANLSFDGRLINLSVGDALVKEIDDLIIAANKYDEKFNPEEWMKHPFRTARYGSDFEFEVHYTMTFSGITTENYVTVKM